MTESEQRLRDSPDEKRQIADALRAGTITESDRLAAFVLDEATTFASNPFPSITAGAARQRWGLREIEFEAMQVASAELLCLLANLRAYLSAVGELLLVSYYQRDHLMLFDPMLHGSHLFVMAVFLEHQKRGIASNQEILLGGYCVKSTDSKA